MGKETIYFVTGNAGKLKEVMTFLQPSQAEIAASDSQDETPFPYHLEAVKLDLDELQSESAEQISQVKALEAFRLVNGLSADGVVRQSFKDAHGQESFSLTFTLSSQEPANPAAMSLKPVLVDDTSLSFAALGDMPGPYIKFFLKALGPDKLANMVVGFGPGSPVVPETEDTRLAAGLTYMRATASSIFTLARASVQDEEEGRTTYVVRTTQFIGNSPGRLVSAPAGAHGFGWDSAFAPLVNPCNYEQNKAALAAYSKDPVTGRFPQPTMEMGFTIDARAFTKTYGELTHEEKNVISHRAVALRKMKAALTKP